MKEQIVFKNLAAKEHASELLQRQLQSLEKHLAGFSPGGIFLHGVVEKHATRELYRINLVLKLPRRTLSSHEEGHDLDAALREAFLELGRQVKKYKALLRNAHLWKQTQRRHKIRELIKATPGGLEAERYQTFLREVEPHLEDLYNFLWRQWAYHLHAGDVLPQDAQLEDSLEECLLCVFYQEVAPDQLLTALLKEALSSLDRRLHQIREDYLAHPEILAVAQNWKVVEQFPAPTRMRLGPREIADLLQRDQLRGHSPWQSHVLETLAHLPVRWRRAFDLYFIQQLELDEAAQVLALPPAELDQLLEYATEYLAEKTRDLGLEPALIPEEVSWTASK